MITEAIYGVLCRMLAWLLALLPTWERPSWVTGLIDSVTDGATQIGDLSHWIPLGHIAIVASFVLASWAIAFGLESSLRLVSHLTGGGGAR